MIMTIHEITRAAYDDNGGCTPGTDQAFHLCKDGAGGRLMRVSEPLMHLCVARNSRKQRGIKRCLIYIRIREEGQAETKQRRTDDQQSDPSIRSVVFVSKGDLQLGRVSSFMRNYHSILCRPVSHKNYRTCRGSDSDIWKYTAKELTIGDVSTVAPS